MKYSVGLPVSNGRHRVNCAHAQIAWLRAKWMLASPGCISNQSCLHCVETLRSRNGRQRSKEAVQSARYAGRRLPMAKAQSLWRTIFAWSIVRRTYDELIASNSETQREFIWNLCPVGRGKRGSFSLYLRCSTTVNWLTDTYGKQLTGLAFACQFTALKLTSWNHYFIVNNLLCPICP